MTTEDGNRSPVGPELAETVGKWLGRDVTFDPITPEEFGQRVGDALNNPRVAFALGDLYGSISQLDHDAMVVDLSKVEDVFGVKLSTVTDHLAKWHEG